MKFFILLHNQIRMAQATIMNSHERWFPIDVREVMHQLRITVMNYRDNDNITEYQYNKLIEMIEGIPYEPTDE